MAQARNLRAGGGKEAAYTPLLQQDPSGVADRGTSSAGRSSDLPISLPRGDKEARLTKTAALRDTPPTVQFASPAFYAKEDEGKVHVELIRFEPLDRRSVVRISTKNGTAIAGEHYKALDQQVVFEKGDYTEHVEIQLIGTPDWNTLLEFKVQLDIKNGGENASLGRYLWQANVMTIDTDSFPSNEFETLDPNDVSPLSLLSSYCKLVWRLPKERQGTYKGLAVVTYRSVASLLKLLLNVYLVDSILNEEFNVEDFPPGVTNRKEALIGMTAILLFLFAMHHFSHYQTTKFGVGGGQRLLIQKSVMRKYMNMEESARQTCSSATIVQAMTRDAVNVVARGYNMIFALSEQFGNLCAIIIFQLIAKFVFKKELKPIAIFPMVATPPLLMLFGRLRNSGTVAKIHERNRQQDDVAGVVFDACENYELISDYSQKAYFVEKLEGQVAEYHKAKGNAARRVMNDEYFAPWVSQLFVSVYFVFGGLNVIDGETSLGMFLTNAKIISELGSIWSNVYSSMINITEAGPSLVNLTQILNLKTDSEQRMGLSRELQSATLAKAEMNRQDANNEHLAYDDINIAWSNLNIPLMDRNMSGNIEIAQGEFVIVSGAHAVGKAMLLSILGGRLMPAKEDITNKKFYFPSHLRVLHVGAPLFFDDSLMVNLTFGVEKGDDDGNETRVKAILKKLRVPDRIIRMLNDEYTKPWIGMMSATEAIKLHLARAFIANPEILIMHRPLDTLRRASADALLLAISEFVRNKGLEQDEGTWNSRRPRTCIMSASKESDIKYCDKVAYVDPDLTVSVMHPDELHKKIAGGTSP